MNLKSELVLHLEALLFSAGDPLPAEDILACLKESLAPDLTLEAVEDLVIELKNYCSDDQVMYQIHFTAGGYQLLTKSVYYATLSKYYKQQSNKRLSRSAMEVLSIIAYRQPITKAEIEQIRGVGADYAVNKLLERDLIVITGRDPGPGRPLLYGTSPQFMDYFGLGDISDLPKLKELQPKKVEEIGAKEEITEPKDSTDHSGEQLSSNTGVELEISQEPESN